MTVDPGNDALNRAAAELSADEPAAIAADLHRLDDASTLVEVLQWLVDCSRRRCAAAALLVVRGAALQPWHDRGAGESAAPAEPSEGQARRFALNVGGRVVAVLVATPPNASAVAAIDILTSYASRLLESMTLHKALGLVPPRAEHVGSGVV